MAQDFKTQLDRILKGILSKEVLEQVGEFVVQLVKERVRGQGQGVRNPGSPTSKLKPLSKDYIKQRARDKKLHPETSPSRSNLTRHGDMLDALTFTIKNGSLTVEIKNPKQLLKAIYTHEARPWVNISKGEETKIVRFIESLIADKLRTL